MTEVKHAGGLVSSSKVPALHLIPTEALLCLADRFEVGTKRKGDGAWNALTKNQECLDDNAFLIERCSHIIRHTMMLRDQLAHGYSSEDEDTPYENAGAIIFGGALMACAMARRGACAMCGLCFTEAGQVACRDCMAYEATGCPVEAAHEPVESPDDWVELPPEHILRRGVDQYSSGKGENLRWYDVEGLEGDRVSDWPHDKARCRRKDLPAPQPVESPDDWVVQDRVPRRPGVDEYRRVDYKGNSIAWCKAESNLPSLSHGHIDVFGNRLEVRCLKKDLPEIETPPVQPSLHPPSAGASFRCRNHGVISGLESNPTQSLWFWPNRSDVCWDLYGKAVSISQDWTDSELRGFDIVAKIDLPEEAKCQDGTA